MNQINLVLPNQLFKNSPLFTNNFPFYLVEEYLFFKQYPFHKQKIAFHRSTMKRYANFIQEEMNLDVHYIESIDSISDIRLLIANLKEIGVKQINYIDPVDGWIQKRLNQSCSENKITTKQFPSPLFINTQEDLKSFFTNDKKNTTKQPFIKTSEKSILY